MKSADTFRPSHALFQPFVRIAGVESLLLGLAAVLLAGWVGSWSGLHFDGVLDVHVGTKAPPLWLFLAEGIIDWLSLAIILYVAGKLLSRTAFRAIDLLGTQALARWPMLLVSFACLAPGFHRFSAQLMEAIMKMGADPTKFAMPADGMGAAVFSAVTMLMLTCVVWMVVLQWKSFSHCCNLRGGKAITVFILCLLIAEVASKAAIVRLFKLI
jgi:hypothetical protein